MKRYAVEKCDEGGTLTRETPSGSIDVPHTWNVVDRARVVDGYPVVVANCDTRKAARETCAELNKENA